MTLIKFSLVKRSINVKAVEVTPNGSGTFSYWTYNGEIVSYDSNYSFYASGDADITAVFNESVQAKPTAVISGVASSPEI